MLELLRRHVRLEGEVEHPDHAVQRRAYFVAHHRDELGPRLGVCLRVFLRLLQGRLRAAAFADVPDEGAEHRDPLGSRPLLRPSARPVVRLSWLNHRDAQLDGEDVTTTMQRVDFDAGVEGGPFPGSVIVGHAAAVLVAQRFRDDDLFEHAASHLLASPAEDLFRLWVPVDNPASRVDGDDGVE